MALNQPLDSRLLPKDLRKLESVLGATVSSISGLNMPSWLLSPVVNLETSARSIQISGVVDESDFDQEVDTYASLRIEDASLEEIQQAKESGSAYFQVAGERINEIQIVREVISQTTHGLHTWKYVADVAIVFALDKQSLVFRLSTLHNELIKVEHVENFRLDAFTRPISSFEDDVFTTHHCETFILTLDECASDAERGTGGFES